MRYRLKSIVDGSAIMSVGLTERPVSAASVPSPAVPRHASATSSEGDGCYAANHEHAQRIGCRIVCVLLARVRDTTFPQVIPPVLFRIRPPLPAVHRALGGSTLATYRGPFLGAPVIYVDEELVVIVAVLPVSLYAGSQISQPCHKLT
jgi:hypothetical protein